MFSRVIQGWLPNMIRNSLSPRSPVVSRGMAPVVPHMPQITPRFWKPFLENTPGQHELTPERETLVRVIESSQPPPSPK